MNPENRTPSRRIFLKKTFAAGALLPFLPVFSHGLEAPAHAPSGGLKVHVFSKHLQFLNYSDMADAAARLGFDGVDLTVRPKGHVLPERVEDDLPKAVEAIRKVGLEHTMMTTAVEDAANPLDRKVLEVAARLGIRYYRMNWLPYPDEKPGADAMARFKKTIKALGTLNSRLGITGCYQNHAGNRAGASIWELSDMVSDADPAHMGVQYDIRHAVVEGGLSWRNGLRLIHPRIKTLTMKDFLWGQENGVWDAVDVPLGDGMVDMKSYLALLKKFQIQVPISLHFEYPLGGAEHGATTITVDRETVFAAMKKDLGTLRALWDQTLQG